MLKTAHWLTVAGLLLFGLAVFLDGTAHHDAATAVILQAPLLAAFGRIDHAPTK